jgi:WD40 repeat protein
VLRGSSDGSVRCWNRKTAALVKTWEHAHTAPVRCIKFNPTALNFTSTCNNINMWIPKPQVAKRPNDDSPSFLPAISPLE